MRRGTEIGAVARGARLSRANLLLSQAEQVLTAMPRDGSLILSDVERPALMIICGPCGRRGPGESYRDVNRCEGGE
jgi:hypothetical protein